MSNTSKTKYYLFLALSLVVISFDGVFFKMASNYEVLSKQYIMYYSFALIIYVFYALSWQIILKQIDLSVAYTFRSIVIIFGLLWSVIIFKTYITIFNIVGALLIISGIVLVSRYKE